MIIAYLVSLLVSLSAQPNALDLEQPKSAAAVMVARSSMVDR